MFKVLIMLFLLNGNPPEELRYCGVTTYYAGCTDVEEFQFKTEDACREHYLQGINQATKYMNSKLMTNYSHMEISCVKVFR